MEKETDRPECFALIPKLGGANFASSSVHANASFALIPKLVEQTQRWQRKLSDQALP